MSSYPVITERWRSIGKCVWQASLSSRRINELKRAEQGLGPQPVKAVQPANVVAGPSGYNGPMPQIIQHAVPLRPSIVESAALATHLSTIYTDKLYYPSSTITEIVQNGMVPNKFRLQARVKAIFPRNPPTGSPPIANYICFFCKKCERPYKYVLVAFVVTTLSTDCK